mgnify:CR=1 FL=1
MPALPQDIVDAWSDREGPIVFTTVSKDGTPNAIWASCVEMMGDDAIVVANNFFDKTLANVRAGGSGSVLFITKDKKGYQLKGEIEYHESGKVFDFMKEWNPEKLPGHAAALVRVREAYQGATRIV